METNARKEADDTIFFFFKLDFESLLIKYIKGQTRY